MSAAYELELANISTEQLLVLLQKLKEHYPGNNRNSWRITRLIRELEEFRFGMFEMEDKT